MGKCQPSKSAFIRLPSPLREFVNFLLQVSSVPSTKSHYEWARVKLLTGYVQLSANFGGNDNAICTTHACWRHVLGVSFQQWHIFTRLMVLPILVLVSSFRSH